MLGSISTIGKYEGFGFFLTIVFSLCRDLSVLRDGTQLIAHFASKSLFYLKYFKSLLTCHLRDKHTNGNKPDAKARHLDR